MQGRWGQAGENAAMEGNSSWAFGAGLSAIQPRPAPHPLSLRKRTPHPVRGPRYAPAPPHCQFGGAPTSHITQSRTRSTTVKTRGQQMPSCPHHLSSHSLGHLAASMPKHKTASKIAAGRDAPQKSVVQSLRQQRVVCSDMGKGEGGSVERGEAHTNN